MSLRIKKGDTVKILAGASKGQTGEVIAVDPKNNCVKVENLNMITRHKKARSAQEQGGIIKMEGNIDISNVMLVCPACDKATRIATVEVEGKSHRQCKHCGYDFDAKKAEKKETKKRATKATKAEGETEAKANSRVKRTRKSAKTEATAE
ncbi:MAG: 50S ribosomal protein L24 [Clostridia bacterium]|nr:50S ribosomal protein L24 [Clostridia bacterium]